MLILTYLIFYSTPFTKRRVHFFPFSSVKDAIDKLQRIILRQRAFGLATASCLSVCSNAFEKSVNRIPLNSPTRGNLSHFL